MATAGGLLPVPVAEAELGSSTANASLNRFVWAARRCFLSSSVLQVVPGRAALAVWVVGLELREFRVGVEGVESPDAPSVDERMLDWIVASVKSGWTTGEVLIWIFPSFGGMLFNMICDGSVPA